MELKEGYKQTEVGVIPSDWGEGLMSEIGESFIGLTYSPNNVMDYGILVLRSSNIQNGQLAYDNNVFVDMELPDHVITKEDDLLICVRNGSKHLIGKCALIDKKAAGSAFGAFMSLYRSESNKYIIYQFQSNVIQRQINEVLGATINQITNKDLASFRIPLPPTKAEQTAIATALSDADALIQSLEKLIAKKRNIKQGAMQKLLIPKGGWVVKKLGNVADIRSGGTPSTNQQQFWDGDVLWCTPTDITALNGYKYLSDTNRKITQIGLKSSSAEMIPSNSIVMTSRATIGECAINTVPVSTNQGFKNLIPFSYVDVEFLYYLLLTQKQKFINLCAGSTFLEIGKVQLNAFELQLPTTKAEQTRIAAILSDMDAEIAALETKLVKYRQIKQGMMQELLTGRIRLV